MRVDAVPPVGSEGPAARLTPASVDPGSATSTAGATSPATPAAPGTTPTRPTSPVLPVLPPFPGTDPGAVASTRPAAAAPLAWARADRLLDDVGAVLARLADLVTTARTTTDPAVRAQATAEANRLVEQVVAALRGRGLGVPPLAGDAGAGALSSGTAAADAAGAPSGAVLVLAVRDGLRPSGVLRLPIAGVTVSVPIPTVDAAAPFGSGRAALDRFAAALRTDLAAAGLAGVLVVVDEARAAVRLVPALLVSGTTWPTAPEVASTTASATPVTSPAAAATTGGGSAPGGALPAAVGATAGPGGTGASGAPATAAPATAGAGSAATGTPVAGSIGAAVRAALADNLRGLPDVRGVLAAAVAAADRRPVEAVAALLATTRAGIAALGLAGGHAVGHPALGGDLAGLAAAVDDLAAAIVAAGPAALLAHTAGADRPALVLLLLAGMLGHPAATAPPPSRTDEPAAPDRRRREDPDADAETEDNAPGERGHSGDAREPGDTGDRGDPTGSADSAGTDPTHSAAD